MDSLARDATWFCRGCRWLLVCFALSRAALASAESPTADLKKELKKVVRQSFAVTHDGWSSDEVLVQDALNAAFLQACRRRLPGAADRDFNWTLLNLRKAKQLDAAVTRRKPARHGAYRHAAEIAARLLEDRYRMNVDRVLCDPLLRAEFDVAAKEIAPETSAYLLRKAALGLRKSRRLRPELVVRVADWNRIVQTFTLANLHEKLGEIPAQPGIYLFMDESGYLYIGEAGSLRKRLTEHLRHSDRPSLAKYLQQRTKQTGEVRIEIHAFPADSPARKVSLRRAYESELIRSRKPRFNVRP